MELRVQQARAIVHEINTVLPQKINLMNKDGIIIASTDPGRIHTFHGGAARVIRENLDELRIYRENEYPGTRPGTNFMLQVEGVPIGVLGITGSYESILPIANVIRKGPAGRLPHADHDDVHRRHRLDGSYLPGLARTALISCT